MPRASNYTFLAEVRSGPHHALAVYKPRDGETPLWDFPNGTLCRREVAAFLLADALGWPRVPPTVLREGPLGPGSTQLFIDAAPTDHFFTLRGRFMDAFREIAAFDVVANNTDRKAGHCLLGNDGTIWAVDHGVCFNIVPKLRTVIWDFAGEPLSARLIDDLLRVARALRSSELADEMGRLLDRGEVEATAGRAELLARSGRFPHPHAEGRHYPWPAV